MQPITDYNEACTILEVSGPEILTERLKYNSEYCFKILKEAARRRNKKIVRAAVEFAGSDSVNEALCLALDKTEFGASVPCDPKLVKLFIPYADCKHAGSPALVKTAKHNDLENFNLLLPHSEISDRNAYSILSYGIQHKNTEILKATVPYLTDPGRVGQAVMKAIKVGYTEGVETLLPRANLIVLFKIIGKETSIYNTEISHQSALDNAEIFKCLDVVNATFKEKMNYNLFEDMPELNFYRTTSKDSKAKM